MVKRRKKENAIESVRTTLVEIYKIEKPQDDEMAYGFELQDRDMEDIAHILVQIEYIKDKLLEDYDEL